MLHEDVTEPACFSCLPIVLTLVGVIYITYKYYYIIDIILLKALISQ